MKKGRIVIIIFAIIVIIGQLTIVDYTNLSWAENTGSYLGIISMILIIISMIVSHNYELKSDKKQSDKDISW